MLGKTQCTKNEDWLTAVKNIECLVSKTEIDNLTERTVWDIKKTVGTQKSAFSWSGGKDSMVLEQLCYLAGIGKGLLVITNLEYPAFYRWIGKHKPSNIKLLCTGQDLLWLAKHQHLLFPRESWIAARWFQIVQHRGQNQFFYSEKLDIMLLGRRKIDGNYVGEGNRYKTKSGVVRYSPMADWTHEHILAFIHYHQLPWAPFYAWKNGFVCSTHPWAARQYTDNGWEDVYTIDKSIVREAAFYIKSAKQFLLQKGGNP
jgi:3'-phosphoadenosine 5'-phosphosulfate sulfotransferase (PAPS reductase)/FAD synthetase